MPMELRKRKAPTNPPAPAPTKKSKTAESRKKVAAKPKEVKEAIAPTKKPVAKKKVEKPVKAAVEKKKAPPAEQAPAVEKAPEPEAKADAKAEAPVLAAPSAADSTPSASTAPVPPKKGRGRAAAVKESKESADAKAEAKPEAKSAPKLKVGDTLPTDLAEVTLDDGSKTTFDKLLDASEKGIVLFSYTKASTAGCTTQACALRDSYSQFTAVGYLVYGLSGDSPPENAKFRSKQNLGYPLLSDPTYVFHDRLGIKNPARAATIRSVVVVQKEGKIIKELKQVTPKNSLDVAKKAVGIESAAAEKRDRKKDKEDDMEKKAEDKRDVTVGTAAPHTSQAPTMEETAKPTESS